MRVSIGVYTRLYSSYFFFQAEDGIRDYKVTGVQTCALPICEIDFGSYTLYVMVDESFVRAGKAQRRGGVHRSEERCVGKECRSRWSPYHSKKNYTQARPQRSIQNPRRQLMLGQICTRAV